MISFFRQFFYFDYFAFFDRLIAVTTGRIRETFRMIDRFGIVLVTRKFNVRVFS